MDEKREELKLYIQNIENCIFKLKKIILKIKNELDIDKNEKIKIVIKKPLVKFHCYDDENYDNEDLCIEI
jgi:hypothetical protein